MMYHMLQHLNRFSLCNFARFILLILLPDFIYIFVSYNFNELSIFLVSLLFCVIGVMSGRGLNSSRHQSCIEVQNPIHSSFCRRHLYANRFSHGFY